MGQDCELFAGFSNKELPVNRTRRGRGTAIQLAILQTILFNLYLLCYVLFRCIIVKM